MRDVKTLVLESARDGLVPSLKYFFQNRNRIIPSGYLKLKMVLHAHGSSIRKKVARSFSSGNHFHKNPNVGYAFYDLAVSPPTYDIIDFLVLAEHFCLKNQYAGLHVIIVTGHGKGFRTGDCDSYLDSSPKEKDEVFSFLDWRVRNLLVPSCWLFRSCHSVTFCKTREEAGIIAYNLADNRYPKNYSVQYPVQGYDQRDIVSLAAGGAVLPSIAVPSQALLFVREWIHSVAKDKKVIVITLRESSYQEERNSNISAWAAFASALDPEEYYPVFIRDTEKGLDDTLSEISGYLIVSWACFNLELRAALYELCFLNMSVNNGTMELCIHNENARYINFKMITPAYVSTSPEHYCYLGIEPGTQPVFCTRYQKWVWEDDTFDVIMDEFHQMENKIKEITSSFS